MKTVYLHIGLHKTGTSSIQRFFNYNKNELLDLESVDYLIPSPWPIPFKNKPVIDLCVEGFSQIKKSEARKVVISHENYSWLFESKKISLVVSNILKYCDEIKVVVYLRRQDSLAISQKQEGTKWLDNSVAYGHELKALPSKLNYYSENYLNFYNKVKLWSEAAGKENVIVRVFDKSRLLNGDVVEDFCSQIGITDLSRFKNVGRVNESISRKRQLFLHFTRRFFPENTPEKLLLVERVLNMDIKDDEKLMPSRDEAYRFYQEFNSSNTQLKKEFFPNVMDDVFSDDFSMYQEVSNEHFSEEEKDEVYIKLLQTLLTEVYIGTQSEDKEKLAHWCRDRAIEIEGDNLVAALKLMRRARYLKPNGYFIKSKCEAYQALLNTEK